MDRTLCDTMLAMKYDTRIEIRISTELKERLAQLAKELNTDSADILRIGAAFLEENRQLAEVLVEDRRKDD